MEQFYERHFVDNDDTAFVVPAGKTEMGFIIRMPACGAIPKLIVKQTGDNNTAFKVDLCSLPESQVRQLERGYDVYIRGSNLRILTTTFGSDNE